MRTPPFPLRTLLLACLCAATTLACSDPGGPDDGGGGGGGGSISPAERAVAVAETEAKLESMTQQGVPTAEMNEAVAAWLRTQPGFETAGVDTQTASVWGRFRDGRLLIIANNRAPDPLSDSLRAARGVTDTPVALQRGATEPTELPAVDRVRLLHSFGAGFDQVQAPINDIAGWFEDHGYDVAAGGEGDARVETLRNVSGDGFFYLNTHGGSGKTRDGTKIFAVQSSSIVAPEKDAFPDFKADLENDRLVYMMGMNGGSTALGTPDWDTRYAITYKFVEQYMSFGKNSIVFMNVCHSGGSHPDISSFIFAMHKKGAGVYLGWSLVVSTDAAFSAVRYFVDRLLGANEYRPESPKQRPFAWPEVLVDMNGKGLGIDAATGAQLVARPGSQTGAGIGLLNPSIEWVAPNPDELRISGLFGERPATGGVVEIDDGSGPVALAVKEWTPTLIVTDLPRTGAGSVGDVVVKVREHESNKRRISRWKGEMRYTRRDAGSLTIAARMDIDMRLDPAPYRMKPGEEPGRPINPIVTVDQDAGAEYHASGVYERDAGADCVYRNTWTGGETLKVGGNASGSGYLSTLEAKPKEGLLEFLLVLGGRYDDVFFARCGSGSGSTQQQIGTVSIDPVLLDPVTRRLVLTAGPTLAVPAGRREATVHSSYLGTNGATVSLEWTALNPTPAYVSTHAQ